MPRRDRVDDVIKFLSGNRPFSQSQRLSAHLIVWRKVLRLCSKAWFPWSCEKLLVSKPET